MNTLPAFGQKEGDSSISCLLPTLAPRCSFSLSRKRVEGVSEARPTLSEGLLQAQGDPGFPEPLSTVRPGPGLCDLARPCRDFTLSGDLCLFE